MAMNARNAISIAVTLKASCMPLDAPPAAASTTLTCSRAGLTTTRPAVTGRPVSGSRILAR